MIDYSKLETSTLLRRRQAVEDDLTAINRALAVRGNPANNYGNSLHSSILTSKEPVYGNPEKASCTACSSVGCTLCGP